MKEYRAASLRSPCDSPGTPSASLADGVGLIRSGRISPGLHAENRTE